MDGWIDEGTNSRNEGQTKLMEEQTDGRWTDRQTDGQIDGWTDGRMDRWMTGWMGGWMD